MSFTANYELLPHGVQVFTRLGFANSYFRDFQVGKRPCHGGKTSLHCLLPELPDRPLAGCPLKKKGEST